MKLRLFIYTSSEETDSMLLSIFARCEERALKLALMKFKESKCKGIPRLAI